MPGLPARVVHTTSLVGPVNPLLRKLAATALSSQPSGRYKVLCLAVRSLEHVRGRNAGIRGTVREQAFRAISIYFEDRIPAP